MFYNILFYLAVQKIVLTFGASKNSGQAAR